jgi:hypothetical protein
MRRRAFISLLGGAAAAWPSRRRPVLGYLITGTKVQTKGAERDCRMLIGLFSQNAPPPR